MRLYLVQHGQATSEQEDPQRPLTEQGRVDVQALAALLEPFGLPIAELWHSGKTRAAQTAEILADALEAPDVRQRQGLAPNDPIRPIQAELSEARQDVMIVGHLPFLAKLASSLACGSETAEVVSFRPGGLVCLERSEEGAWSIAWMTAPELLPRGS